MSGLFGGGGTHAAQQPILKGIRAQTSVYGGVIPLVYGRNRLSGNLIWYGDFASVAHKASGGKGGMFGGGGKGGGTSYTYKASVAIALCSGPIKNLFNVYDSTGQLTLTSTTENFTIPGGGGSHAVANAANFYDDHGVGRGDAYSVGPFTDYGSPGPVTLSGTQQKPMALVGSSPGAGQYTQSGGTYGFSAADAGKTVAITYSYATPTSSNNGQPATIINLTLFLGAIGQAAWGYLTTNHPSQADGYSGLAYVGSAAMDLGASGALPNLSYEITGLLPFGGGIVDANPKDVVNDLLTNTIYGLSFPSAEVGDLSLYSNYCVANGLFISPVLDSQRPANDWIKDILEATNSEAVFSSGLLKIIPYGDTTVVGNGVTYSPPTAPVYDLTDDDFLHRDGSDPITISRGTIADVFNNVQVEYLNRANHYNPEIIEEKDQAAIEAYRPRQTSAKQLHVFALASAATLAANTMLKRQVYIRNQYSFSLDRRYVLLDPMDLVTLTDSNLGYSKKPVRILEIQENDNGDLDVKAEDFPWGTAQPTAYPKETGTPYLPNADADPGSINAPVLFEALSRMNDQIGHAVWMGVSGTSTDWGGCTVWASADGTTYKRVGNITQAARTGLLTATLASHSDPDTADTLSVDLAQSHGSLASGSAADCDNFRMLCYADGELISYQDATLVSGNQYNLGTRLRRGVFGSPIGSHASGTKFARLDEAMFTFDYDPTLIGTTMHFKFTSFNAMGKNEQPLSAATDYTLAISGASLGLLTPAHATYRPTTNPLTGHDAGASATVNIAAFSMRVPGITDISLNSGSITGLSYNTPYFIFYDDPGFLGGAVTYQATLVKETALGAAGRFFIGSIATPLAGAADTIGLGDGGSGAQYSNTLSGEATAESTSGSTASWSNASNAIDGQWNSYAESTPGAGQMAIMVLSGYAAVKISGASATLVNLLSATIPRGGTLKVEHSTDGGATWTQDYYVAPVSPAIYATFSLARFRVTLGNAANLSAVQMRVTMTGAVYLTFTSDLKVYDSQIEVSL